MTVSSTTRKTAPLAGTGAPQAYPFAFKVFSTADLLVVQASASGVETTLALGVGYTALLNADQDNAPGGSITATVPLGSTVVITSNVAPLQSAVVTNEGGFFPAVFNAVFDKLTVLAQQLAEKVSRALVIPISSTGVTTLTVPVLAGGVLQWLPDGSGLQAIVLPSLAAYLALPDTTGKSGQFLTNDGLGHFSWSPISAAVPTARLVSTSGLATGGGDLTADRTINVPKALGTDVQANNDTKAVTGKALIDAAAPQALTDAATVVWDTHLGFNARLTLTANGHTVGAPSNLHDGVTYTLNINPATFTVAWNAIWDFGAAGAPVLAASKWNKITAQYDATAGKLQASYWKGA